MLIVAGMLFYLAGYMISDDFHVLGKVLRLLGALTIVADGAWWMHIALTPSPNVSKWPGIHFGPSGIYIT
jgi:hypothetical protein